jgi:hypothetical protein
MLSADSTFVNWYMLSFFFFLKTSHTPTNGLKGGKMRNFMQVSKMFTYSNDKMHKKVLAKNAYRKRKKIA